MRIFCTLLFIYCTDLYCQIDLFYEGRRLLYSNQYPEAWSVYQDYLRDPDSKYLKEIVLWDMAIASFEKGDYQQAKIDIEQAIYIIAVPEFYILRYQINKKLGDTFQAQRDSLLLSNTTDLSITQSLKWIMFTENIHHYKNKLLKELQDADFSLTDNLFALSILTFISGNIELALNYAEKAYLQEIKQKEDDRDDSDINDLSDSTNEDSLASLHITTQYALMLFANGKIANCMEFCRDLATRSHSDLYPWGPYYKMMAIPEEEKELVNQMRIEFHKSRKMDQ